MPTKPSIPTKNNGDLLAATELNTIVDFFENKTDESELVETNVSQFASDSEGDLVLISPYVPVTGNVISFNIGNVIGSEASPNISSELVYDDLTGAKSLNKCWVYSRSTIIPEILSDVKSVVRGDTYSTVSDSLNILEFTFISNTRIICEVFSFDSPRIIPTIEEISSYSYNANTTTVDFTNALVGDLMLVCIGNIITTPGATTTAESSPPIGWDTVINMNNGFSAWTRKKEGGDANTFDFPCESNASPPTIPLIIRNPDYTNGSIASLVLGTSSVENNTNPKTIPSINLTRPSLCLAFHITASNQSTAASFNAGWTLIREIYGGFGTRRLILAEKDSDVTSDDAIVTLTGVNNNVGIIIGI